jgi:uncharacterized protein
MRKLFLFLLIILFVQTGVFSQELPAYQDKYVNDFASFLDLTQQDYLRSIFSEVETNTTAEVVFVSVITCNPYTSSEYANNLFNEWGVGKEDKDNGLMILYCKEENKIWVEVGYGLEGILPDSKVGGLLDDSYVPMRDSGDTAQGIVSFSEEVAKIIHENREEVLSGKSGKKFDWTALFIMILVFGFFIAFFGFFIWIAFRSSRSNEFEKVLKLKGSAFKTKSMTQLDKEKLIKKLQNLKESSGIKKTPWWANALILPIFILMILFFVLSVEFLGLFFLIAFVVSLFVRVIYGNRCEKDGFKMKYVKRTGNYNIYQCPKGHIGKLLRISDTSSHGIHHSSGGGFSGGGGGGGGGFGGGSSGGGGAGR